MNTSDVFNIDCMEYMRTLPDKCFALAIADPPYGIRDSGGSTGGSGKLKGRVFNNGYIDSWDKAPAQAFFDELFRVSQNQIIWGATTSTCHLRGASSAGIRCSRGKTSRKLNLHGLHLMAPPSCSGLIIGRAIKYTQPRNP
jgi:hypothetical protein